MFYDRKIKYVDVYENGEKVQNAGFIKIEPHGEEIGLRIQISGMRATDTMRCPVLLVGDEKEVMLGEVSLEGGKGSVEFAKLDAQNMAGGIAYSMLEEIHIRVDSARLLRCVVQECIKTKQQEVSEPGETVETIAQVETIAPVETVEPVETKSEAELLKEAFLAEKRMREKDGGVESTVENQVMKPMRQETVEVQPAQTVDKWQQLLAVYPHIRPFEDYREYLLVNPRDFVILPQKYFTLVDNSFLLHGYYNYDHLIMSREQRPEGERFYIGVPGNFYDKEKQVAIMFGFESFEGRQEPAKTGDFGYYMIPVEI